MADAKISALNALTTADDADLFAVVDTSATETKKITKANMLSPIVISGANVGIGTASPMSAAGYSWLTINGASAGGIVSLSNADTELGRLQSTNLATTLSTLTAAPLVFKTNNAESMRISSAGLVGIGTSSPSAKLTVNGDSQINSLTIGRGAGNNTSNTVFGNSAFGNNTTGTNNTAVGNAALENNTTAINNTAVGAGALQNNITASYNTAVGRNALENNTTGGQNTAVGNAALENNTTAVNNTAVGVNALLNNTTASNNTAVGTGALLNNTIGTQNTAVSRSALQSNTTGSYDTAVGVNALLNNTTASNNTAVGYQAGDIITTGSRNVIIGQGTDPSAEDGIDQIVVGYSLTGKGNDTAYVGGTNGGYNEKNVTTWETTSDERIKKNIKDNNTGLDILSQIQVRNFEYRTPDEITNLPSHAAIEKDGVQLGVIAQEIQKVLPECVSENSTGVLSVNTDPLVWYLINAVKELKAEIQALKGN